MAHASADTDQSWRSPTGAAPALHGLHRPAPHHHADDAGAAPMVTHTVVIRPTGRTRPHPNTAARLPAGRRPRAATLRWPEAYGGAVRIEIREPAAGIIRGDCILIEKAVSANLAVCKTSSSDHGPR